MYNQLLNEQARLSQALETADHEVARLRREADEHQKEVMRWKEETQHWQMQAGQLANIALHFEEALKKERRSHSSFVARLKGYWRDVLGPSAPSSEQPPVLFAFSTQTGIANKFTVSTGVGGKGVCHTIYPAFSLRSESRQLVVMRVVVACVSGSLVWRILAPLVPLLLTCLPLSLF